MIKVTGPVADMWNKFREDVYPELDESEDAELLDILQESYYCGALSIFSLFHSSFEVGDQQASMEMLDEIGTDLDTWTEQIAELAQAEVGIH